MSAPKRNWTDEQLSAFLDGELNAADTEALARDVETDPAISARVERLGAATRVFLAASREIDDMPMSAGARDMLAAPPSAKVLPFRARNLGAFILEHRAIAASLICAAAVWGIASGLQPKGGMFEQGADGVILASSPLYRALETGASGVPVSAGAVSITPRLTFASADGDFCRQFDVASGSGATSAIACRGSGQSGGKWRTQVAVFGVAQTGDYQAASGGKSPALEAFIDQNIVGAPLNAEAEAVAIAKNWAS